VKTSKFERCYLSYFFFQFNFRFYVVFLFYIWFWFWKVREYTRDNYIVIKYEFEFLCENHFENNAFSCSLSSHLVYPFAWQRNLHLCDKKRGVLHTTRSAPPTVQESPFWPHVVDLASDAISNIWGNQNVEFKFEDPNATHHILIAGKEMIRGVHSQAGDSR
jgi:hypothetical protein